MNANKQVLRQLLLLFSCILLGNSGLLAQYSCLPLQQPVKIEIESASLSVHFSHLAAQGVTLSYNHAQLDLNRTIRLTKGTYPLREVLLLLLAGDGLEMMEVPGKVILYKPNRKPVALLTLSGFVYSGNTGEVLPGASVYVQDAQLAISTNDYGFYTLQLPPGNHIIRISYIGHLPVIDTIGISRPATRHFKLPGLTQELKVVDVTSDNEPVPKERSLLNTHKTKQAPFPLGEPDPLRMAGLGAGVYSSGGLNVRAGTTDQNLVLLDGAPIYNPYHFTGWLSIFNNDAIKRIDFFKGAFPARYEGRLSSVIDIKTKDGNMEAYHGTANVGFINTSVMLEGPVVKDKISFMGSFRRSWIDGLIRFVCRDCNELTYYLYDANIKLNYRIDSTNRIYLAGYAGSDMLRLGVFSEITIPTLRWGNRSLSFRWNKVINPRLFQNSIVVVSNFKNQWQDKLQSGTKQYNNITDIGVESNFHYSWSNEFSSSAGIKINFTGYRGKAEREDEGLTYPEQYLQAQQLKIYTDNDISISHNIRLKAGLNYTAFIAPGKTYHSFQPRNTLTYRIDKRHELFASYAVMTQFYHQITSSIASLPSEFRAPSTANLPPERSMIFELGFIRRFRQGKFSAQFYGKKFADILMYQPLFDGVVKFGRLCSGTGNSQGLELELDKQWKSLDIQCAYTLGRASMQFDSIYNGRPFRSPNDITHIANLLLSKKLDKQWTLSFSGSFSTGRLVSLPMKTAGAPGQGSTYTVIEPNNHRLSDNYSLNFNAAYMKVYKSGKTGTLQFGINNLFCRPVPFYVDVTLINDKPEINISSPIRLFPYVTYSFSF
ncbi:TonB-dependent receptor [Chitinophaga polysaccharea]|uniref:TonB-dependent receptor n=1 Tax=Chitinophaga polysaccharea TaxID=1293035 RepID=UPI0011A19BEE|nr:TonB-dependent receptor [Chitinophaga polysaccharea]